MGISSPLITRWARLALPRLPRSILSSLRRRSLELAREKGVDIRLKAKVTKINHSKSGVSSVEYEDRETGNSRIIDDITDVVVTAGPWTGRLLPKAKVEGLRAHSVVFDVDVSPYAVFTNIALPNEYSPEHRARKGQRRRHQRERRSRDLRSPGK